MTNNRMSGRAVKDRVLALLKEDDFPAILSQLRGLPVMRVINALFSFFLHGEERIRWRAVVAMGVAVDLLAHQDMEAARVVMRRLMWSLNDESGGIGWGAPEAMGEILARNEKLSEEFGGILISYLNPDGNYLEYEPLQRGLLWGIVRFAQARPSLAHPAAEYLGPYLASGDPAIRGLAALAVGLIGALPHRDTVAKLMADQTRFRMYEFDAFRDVTVGDLAARGMEFLRGTCDTKMPETG